MRADAQYAPAERDWFYNRLVELAVWLVRAGEHVLIAATASRRNYRDVARTQLGPRFAEVWVRCPVEVCRVRDPKGLYGRAAAGMIHGLPGVDVPYEAPEAPIPLRNSSSSGYGASNAMVSSSQITIPNWV
jgi:adenylylsulfate kinase